MDGLAAAEDSMARGGFVASLFAMTMSVGLPKGNRVIASETKQSPGACELGRAAPTGSGVSATGEQCAGEAGADAAHRS
jgi:hypothetical protein